MVEDDYSKWVEFWWLRCQLIGIIFKSSSLLSLIGIGSRIVVGGFNLLGLCEDFHIPGCCSVRGRGNMGIIWWCKPRRGREGENIEIWSKVWKFCTLHPHIISSMELFSEILAKMVQVLPSGRATWAPVPPRMLKTRKILVSILILENTGGSDGPQF